MWVSEWFCSMNRAIRSGRRFLGLAFRTWPLKPPVRNWECLLRTVDFFWTMRPRQKREDVQLQKFRISLQHVLRRYAGLVGADGWWLFCVLVIPSPTLSIYLQRRMERRVIGYLSRDAFDLYWNQVVDPLLAAAGSLKGTVLKQLKPTAGNAAG